jgi:L-threonylcarbamoyladenylate synthase
VRTVTLDADSEASLEHALRILRRGGLVAFPTDTVYGLAAPAFDAEAVERIYAAKGRSAEKAIPVLIGSIGDIRLIAGEVSDYCTTLATRFWPGPLTLVVRKGSRVPAAVARDETVGIRQPDHPMALRLLDRAGPLATTSANLSGAASPQTAADVSLQLDGRIDLILDGGPTPGGVASTVVDCTGSAPRILREGPISLQTITSALN